MVLEDLGQSFRHGAKLFTVGGIALNKESNCGQCGIIEKICTEKMPCPTAICQFSSRSVLERPLDQLEPMNLEMPRENGQLYVLYHTCGNKVGGDEIGVLTQIMGVSSDRSVLLQLMLEGIKKSVHYKLSFARFNEKDDLICFYCEEDEKDGLFLSYIIMLVPSYSKAEGGAAV